MNYKKEQIKEGITLHTIENEKFKTNLMAVFLTVPLKRQTVTLDTLLTLVLRRGCKKMPSQEEISKTLEQMYGASFDGGIEKTGDNHVLKFYLESLKEEFLPEKEELLKESINTLFEILFEPLVEKNAFKKEYVEGEKQNLIQIINGKIDNKAFYALERCIEQMYQNEPYGLYKYGYIEDLESITPETLYSYYQKFIQECKIDIFLSGTVKEELIKENEQIKQLKQRKAEYIINNEQTEEKQTKEIQTVEEKMDVAQGKLVLGLDVKDTSARSKHVALVYNAILGGTPNSKMFQNVREKESLAYTASSGYVRQKNNIFIRCGIEVDNYSKAVELIKQQLTEMKQGEFTDDDLNNAKNFIISTIKGIGDEQDTEISYYLGQELAGSGLNPELYANEIEKVTKEEVKQLADKIQINMIYFLRN